MKKTFLFLGLLLFIGTACSPLSDKEKTDATVSQETIKEHIYYLASDEMKGRNTGSPEILKAADYIADQLKAYGAKPVPGADGYFQPVPLRKKSPATSATLDFSGKNFELGKNLLVLEGQSEKVEGEIVFLNYALEADYEGKDLNGKIVFAKIGDGENTDTRQILQLSRQKYQLALDNGAAGIVEFYNLPTSFEQVGARFRSTSISIDPDGDSGRIIPQLWLKDADNSTQKFMMTRSIKRANIEIKGMVNELTKDKNVLAMIEGTDPNLKDEFIMFSAHYDHIGIGRPDETGDSIYNGTRDNAIGTVTVLSAAENIGKYPMRRSALFVLYTGEEKGLLGSRWMADNPIVPLNEIVFCWNSDNAGYNDTTISTVVGLERFTVVPQLIKDANIAYGLTAIDDPAGEQGLFDRSDNVSFARKGIPAPTYSLGFRSFDGDVTKYYHRAGDNPETVDYDYLYKFFSSYVLASRLIGNADETPFWLEGDKYYEIGKELYGKK